MFCSTCFTTISSEAVLARIEIPGGGGRWGREEMETKLLPKATVPYQRCGSGSSDSKNRAHRKNTNVPHGSGRYRSKERLKKKNRTAAASHERNQAFGIFNVPDFWRHRCRFRLKLSCEFISAVGQQCGSGKLRVHIDRAAAVSNESILTVRQR